MQLFRVKTKGMTVNSTGMAHGLAYVVANDPTEAYNILRKHLDDKNLGFAKDRELDTIELLACEYEYNNIGFMLHLKK